MQDVRDALAAGKTVTISQRSVTVANWTGTGYIITDPNTGSGSYVIGGGADGGYVDVDLGLDWWFWLSSLLDSIVNKIEFTFILGIAGLIKDVGDNLVDMLKECDLETAITLMVPIICMLGIFGFFGFIARGFLVQTLIAILGSLSVGFMANSFRSGDCRQ